MVVEDYVIISSVKFVQVEFVGEIGSDTGGLTREFFSLVSKDLCPHYITQEGCLRHNSLDLQVCVTSMICGTLVELEIMIFKITLLRFIINSKFLWWTKILKFTPFDNPIDS